MKDGFTEVGHELITGASYWWKPDGCMIWWNDPTHLFNLIMMNHQWQRYNGVCYGQYQKAHRCVFFVSVLILPETKLSRCPSQCSVMCVKLWATSLEFRTWHYTVWAPFLVEHYQSFCSCLNWMVPILWCQIALYSDFHFHEAIDCGS